MSSSEHTEAAVELLQQLGLKEYEARCFVGLTRLDAGTAKNLSEITEVPRTRVYDAIRVLEAQGLVQIQHSSPQQFRAVPLDEAMDTLRCQYESHINELHESLNSVDTLSHDDSDPVQQVWSMSGYTAINSRMNDMIQTATDEIILVIGDDSWLTEAVTDALAMADGDVRIGTLTESGQHHIQSAVPDATTFVSGLEWLCGDSDTDEPIISRLLVIDGSSLLVSTQIGGTETEKAVFGTGFENGIVVVARRLMSKGLLTDIDA